MTKTDEQFLKIIENIEIKENSNCQFIVNIKKHKSLHICTVYNGDDINIVLTPNCFKLKYVGGKSIKYHTNILDEKVLTKYMELYNSLFKKQREKDLKWAIGILETPFAYRK